jgi:heme-degrading monooxygenase HmoA
MFVVMNRIEVDAERAEIFERMFSGSMAATLGGVPGLARATLLRPNGPGQPYLATMEFADESSFRAWTTSEAFHRAHPHAARDGSPAGANNVETYTLIAEANPEPGRGPEPAGRES